MGTRVIRARAAEQGVAHEELARGLETIRVEQQLPDGFSPEVQQAAERDAAAPRLPDADRTDLPFVTIDPPGARDLDQAMHLERDGDGFVVHYAIADVVAFVAPGDPVDVEAHQRGESLYGADRKIPLHPPVLSEGAASLLPDQVRPAFVWTVRLDAEGRTTAAHVERARVRSTAQLDYASVQPQVEGADPGSTLALLRTVGELRLAQEAARGGISLPMPSQELEERDGRWHLEYREMLPVESWNAQVSLLTGFAAAEKMLAGRIGVLRTLPPAPDDAVRRLRRTARALGIEWPAGLSHPDLVRSLDPTVPAHAAMVVAATTLLRGAGYAVFDGTVPEQSQHAALASSYAHVTAPLRRLVDRYGLEVCAALDAGTAVPAWVREGLPRLPELMRDSGRRAGAYERALLDLAEALALADRVGEQFDAVVLEASEDNPRKGTVMLRDPAVEARVGSQAPLPVGDEVRVRLTQADPATRKVAFEV
ncbi:Exoribonuclease R [Nocardioides scoriae]|uniref:Exoribonuclease R n=1 Tax=Nocardioides scoriae TaxID=642780 RepID=A0A1H1M8S9_9ACTN|nr:RNB domain-containing ribonuclease [Nocardioides scoriae]SDR83203.1 Exoribonuclease R [Nocardioides scoriae]